MGLASPRRNELFDWITMHDRLPPSLQGNSRRAGNDVLHLLSRGHLTPICGHGIGQPGLAVLTQTAASCLTCSGLSSYQEMPPVTSFSMASSCACNKVWLAECNELQIRRLYLRLALHGHHGVAADGSRPQRTYSTIRDRSRTLPVVSLSVLFGRVGAASNKGT